MSRFPRWFKVRIVSEFDVFATGPKTATKAVLDGLRDNMIELDELELKARDMKLQTKHKAG